MIFVTVGTQIPFDRLIRMVDEIAPQLNGEEIIAQSCNGDYVPVNFKTEQFIPPARFEQNLAKTSSLCVANSAHELLQAVKNEPIPDPLPSAPSPQLISAIRNIIDNS